MSTRIEQLHEFKNHPFHVGEFLDKEVQKIVYSYIKEGNRITKDKILRLRKLKASENVEEVEAILYEKSNTVKQVYFSLTEPQIASYFPKGYTMQQMEEVILTLLDEWSKKEKR